MGNEEKQPGQKQPEQEQSTTGAVADAVQAARTGAQVGSKLGGAHGAAAGAAIGAGAKLLKNKRTRKLLIGVLLVMMLPSLVLPLVIGQIIGATVTQTVKAANSGAVEAAAADGVSPEDVQTYQQAADSTGTHWAILAAADYAAGNWGGPGDPAFGIDKNAFNDAVTELDLAPVDDDKNTQAVGYAWGRLLAARLVAEFPDVNPYSIDVGAGTATDPQDPDRRIRALDEDNPDSVAAHNATKEAFVKVLGEMPTSTKGEAQKIFDTAFRWLLGQQETSGASACAPSSGAAGSTTTAIVNGADANGDIPKVAGFNSDQVKNVIVIVQVGQKLKLPERAWQIAIMTALVESQALNVNFGHADSLGLFQQRPSAGWGTAAEITDPEKAALAFYGKADHTKNPGLTDIKGWDKMPMGAAAQAVQASAVPDAYAKRESEAAKLLEAVAGTAAVDAVGSTADCSAQGLGEFANCPPSGWDQLEKPAELGKLIPPDALRTLRCGRQAFPQFTEVGTYGQRPIAADEHGTGRAVDWMVPGGWKNAEGRKAATEMANWLVKNWKPLGVEYIIWDNKIWNVERDAKNATFPQGWRPYKVCSPPNGTAESCGPTAAHLDHVHVTLYGNKGVVDSDTTLADGAWTIPLRDNYQIGAGVCSAGLPCWGYGGHTGQDFAANENAPVLAAAGGVVKKAVVLCPTLSNSQRAGNEACSYGRFVVVDHGGGVETYYAHLNDFGPGIKEGARVKGGQQVGIEGSQGNSSGPHLHFEVRKGGAIVNPIEYLEQQGVKIRCDPRMQGYYGAVPAGNC